MYLKDSFISKSGLSSPFIKQFTAILITVSVVSGCVLFETSERDRIGDSRPAVSGIDNLFNPPGQVIAGVSVSSIQLYKYENPLSAPFYELGSDHQLQLRFDHIGSESRQFRVTFTHHNPDWTRSSLSSDQFLDGLQNITVSGGDLSQNSQPYYRQFSFRFPNRDVNFRVSGNYMLRVEDSLTGNLVFTIPFFVTENKGSVRSSVEELTVPRQNLRTSHRPVSLYRLPEEVDQPQFDLRFHYVQNRFWGRFRIADELDFSSPDEVQFELSRQRSFTGDYEFRILNLDGLSQLNPQVSEADLTRSPPKVILEDEAEGFPRFLSDDRRGRASLPATDPNRGYAEVLFRFDPDGDIPEDGKVYLTGDFNNWSIRSEQKLEYNQRIDRWETSAIMKEGRYHYKYILIQNNRIDDLYFDQLFGRVGQEYHALVYMRDSRNFYYRLLQTNQFFR